MIWTAQGEHHLYVVYNGVPILRLGRGPTRLYQVAPSTCECLDEPRAPHDPVYCPPPTVRETVQEVRALIEARRGEDF